MKSANPGPITRLPLGEIPSLVFALAEHKSDDIARIFELYGAWIRGGIPDADAASLESELLSACQDALNEIAPYGHVFDPDTLAFIRMVQDESIDEMVDAAVRLQKMLEDPDKHTIELTRAQAEALWSALPDPLDFEF